MRLRNTIKTGFSKITAKFQNCCGKSFIGKQILFGTGEEPAELPLTLVWTDIGLLPFDTSDVANWNTYFGSGTPFTSVTVTGNQVDLYGGAGITILAEAFLDELNVIVSINDQALCIVELAADAFAQSISLTSVTINACTEIGDSAFLNCRELVSLIAQSCTDVLGSNVLRDCKSIETIQLNSCTSLGATTGDDSIFLNDTGTNITLTIPTALMTADGGSPDGDIQYLITNNPTLTIITV